MQTDCKQTAPRAPAASRVSAPSAEQLHAYVREIRAATGVPGIGVGVSACGRHAFACAGTLSSTSAAPLTEEACFQLGCVAKSLLAAVALEQARHGALELRAPLEEYLPELCGTPAGRRAQVAHLLSHTSGYQGTNPLSPSMRGIGWEAFVDYLKRAPQYFAPGTVFNYEHSEAAILARVLRRTTSQSGAQLIRRTLLEPLRSGCAAEQRGGAERVFAGHHELDPRTRRYRSVAPVRFGRFWHDAFAAAGISLRELLTLSDAFMGAPGVSGRAAVSAWARGRLHAPAVHLPRSAGGPLAEMLPVAFGLGAAVLRGGFLGNTGVAEGQCVGMRYDPAAAVSVVVGINARLPHLRDFVLETLCRHLTNRAAAQPDDRPFGFDLAELAGVYRGPGEARVYAAVDGGRLACLITPRSRAEGWRAELEIDATGRPALHSMLPQLSLGFFREPGGTDIGLMLGLNAYKRLGQDERAHGPPRP